MKWLQKVEHLDMETGVIGGCVIRTPCQGHFKKWGSLFLDTPIRVYPFDWTSLFCVPIYLDSIILVYP